MREVGAYGQHTIISHLRYQRAERRFHVLEVAIDIRMVELDGGDNCAVRAVMEKLGALVEKGGVVLVAFDHEIGSRTEAIVRIEVARHSTYEHRRVASRRGEHVRHHRGRRGLAM